MVKFTWQHNLPVGSYGTFKMPPGRLDFWCSKGKKWDPRVTPKLKVREVSQSGFWNISSHPTSEPSFSQIGWPQLLAPGTLSQTMTLKLINLQRKKILYDARKRRLHSKSAKVLRVIREREIIDIDQKKNAVMLTWSTPGVTARFLEEMQSIMQRCWRSWR